MVWYYIVLIVLACITCWLGLSALFYKQFFKRFYDIFCALLALTVFFWLYALIAILVKIKLGSPVLFTQIRPGKKGKDGKERLFKLYKFRSMTDERDENGNLLPDEKRLTKFGAFLRSTSLDEIPEAINILKGDMSVIGPRPQLVRDMVFMSEEQRHRHDVRPGLSGLAQVRGRNAISWEGKLSADLEYVQEMSLFGDMKIIFLTVIKALKREGITEEGMATAEDYGDELLRLGSISLAEYEEKQFEAIMVLSSR